MNNSKMSANICDVALIENVEVSKIVDRVSANGFVILRGLIDSDEMGECVKKVWNQFDPKNDIKIDPRNDDHQTLKKKNFQRLLVGQSNHYCGGIPKFTRTFYNPLSDEDSFGMHSIFEKAIRVRNIIYQVDPNFTLNGPEDGVYSMARIQHYPRGGGFFSGHKDAYAATMPLIASLNGYYQIVLVMTERSRDFDVGGAFIYNNEKFIDIEAFAQPGDMIVYDGASNHGVDDIDPMAPLDMFEKSGRLAGFVTLGRD